MKREELAALILDEGSLSRRPDGHGSQIGSFNRVMREDVLSWKTTVVGILGGTLIWSNPALKQTKDSTSAHKPCESTL